MLPESDTVCQSGYATALSIRNRHSDLTYCYLTFGYCFHIISSVTPQSCVRQLAYGDPKCLMRFFIPLVYVYQAAIINQTLTCHFLHVLLKI